MASGLVIHYPTQLGTLVVQATVVEIITVAVCVVAVVAAVGFIGRLFGWW